MERKLGNSEQHRFDKVAAVSNWVDLRESSRFEVSGLDGPKKIRCITIGQSNSLNVDKSVSSQAACIGGGTCDFEVSFTNPGKRVFDGLVL